MSMFSGRKAYLPLDEGKAYKVVLQEWVERELETPTETGITGFVQFKWKLLADDRIITDSRSFPVGTDILAQQTIIQIGDEKLNAMEQEDLFKMLIDSGTELNMWIERRTKDSDLFTNYHFREVLPKPTPATATTKPVTFH